MPLIIHARRSDFQCAAPNHELPRRRFPVPHNLRPAALIAPVPVPRDVVLDFGLERLLQHFQRPWLQHLVQRALQFLVFFRRLLDYSQHGWRLLLPEVNREVLH